MIFVCVWKSSWISRISILISSSQLFRISGKLFRVSPSSILALKKLVRSSPGALWGLTAAPWELVICQQALWIVTLKLFGSILELPWPLLSVREASTARRAGLPSSLGAIFCWDVGLSARELCASEARFSQLVSLFTFEFLSSLAFSPLSNS